MFSLNRDSHPKRRFLIPQVIQSSGMDCGPASLKALLEGFGISISYGRLREACQTDVDGTSIDTLEDLAQQLGLDAVQVLIPVDHVLLPEAEALPALIVTRQPNGLTHFIIIWRLHGDWVQIMDPGTGRHWIPVKELVTRIYQHKQLVAIEDWLAWAVDEGFCDPLKARLLKLCDDSDWIDSCIQQAQESDCWEAIAALDAATRMISSLIAAGGVEFGAEAQALMNQFQKQPETIPPAYWSVSVVPDDAESLVFNSAVLIHVSGLFAAEQHEPDLNEDKQSPKLSPELKAALDEKTPVAELQLWNLLREDGLLTPLLIVISVILAGLGATLEIVILRGLVEIHQQIELVTQQKDIFVLVIFFLISLLLLEGLLSFSRLRLGRHLEIRLRKLFLEKIPHLEDRYFHSRLISDMAQRAYELRQVRVIPQLAVTFLQLFSQIFFITLGLIVLFPSHAGLVLVCNVSIIALSVLTQPFLQEQDLRFRTHTGSLSRFYLDALQGLMPIRSHRAMPALRTEHESLLVDWVKAGQGFFLSSERITLLNLLFSNFLSIWLVFAFIQESNDSSSLLVLIYWLLMLPQLGQSLAETVGQYPSLRNRFLRLLEPINAPDESHHWYPDDLPRPEEVPLPQANCQQSGVAVNFHQASLELSGHPILHNFNTELAAGEHVAVVGASGAGKSSLVGLLLGWHRPASGGSVWVDGNLLHGEYLHQLRRESVWVDPEVQLWNQSLLDNLNYGNESTDLPMPEILTQADLLELLARLPEAEQTMLGESGGLLSGGEGQRVRLGRGLNRTNPRLVILDEPFRGLTRNQRHTLLANARSYWQNATLIFISHDVGDTQDFDRVWVIDKGVLVEDDKPKILMDNPQSAYATLLDIEHTVRKAIWGSADWIRLKLENGTLHQKV